MASYLKNHSVRICISSFLLGRPETFYESINSKLQVSDLIIELNGEADGGAGINQPRRAAFVQ